ncbi:hypothetical protein [Vibrio phage vB_VmeM-Yong XC32]|nr:hypothetical protein [Vibrio phage vB_VmeM-Yong XC31]QAX96329.1 hypothetical protein [Vibrio phage vB_VmeM-Yong XC32]QAX96647.1 hypothetical protein [Vibrio phage vB_VmeM-Yong MS31]QAX96965.1 hypothetical protein [Vibrio phage vB_VmeM-Yong MS32]
MNTLRKSILASIDAGKKTDVTPESQPQATVVEQLFGADAMANLFVPRASAPVESEYNVIFARDTQREFENHLVSMESIHSYLERSEAEGGCTAQAAELPLAFHASLIERESTLRSAIEVPSMESFDMDGAALMQTQAAKGAYGESIATCKAVIASTIEAATAEATKFYAEHGENVADLAKAIGQIDAAKDVKGEAVEASLKPRMTQYLGSTEALAGLATALVAGSETSVAAMAAIEAAIEAAKEKGVEGLVEAIGAEIAKVIEAANGLNDKELPAGYTLVAAHDAEDAGNLTVTFAEAEEAVEGAAIETVTADAAKAHVTFATASVDNSKAIIAAGVSLNDVHANGASILEKVEALTELEGVEAEAVAEVKEAVELGLNTVATLKSVYPSLSRMFTQSAEANAVAAHAILANLGDVEAKKAKGEKDKEDDKDDDGVPDEYEEDDVDAKGKGKGKSKAEEDDKDGDDKDKKPGKDGDDDDKDDDQKGKDDDDKKKKDDDK